MGNSESQTETTQQPSEPSPYGYQILKVQTRSPCDQKGLRIFFDFIIGINGVSLGSGDVEEFLTILRQNTDKEVRLTILNLQTRRVRDVHVVPSLSWGGNQQLGINIRLCSTVLATEIVWHVLDVEAKSPAAEAGLEMDNDYIVGSPSVIFTDYEDLFSLIQTNIGKPLNFFVFNKARDDVRMVTLTPNDSWGGNGSLGCDVGYGALHRLPGFAEGPIVFDDGVPELEILTDHDLALAASAAPPSPPAPPPSSTPPSSPLVGMADDLADLSSPPVGEPPSDHPPSLPAASLLPQPRIETHPTHPAHPAHPTHPTLAAAAAPLLQPRPETPPSLPAVSSSDPLPLAPEIPGSRPPSDLELLQPRAIRPSADFLVGADAEDLKQSGDYRVGASGSEWGVRLSSSLPVAGGSSSQQERGFEDSPTTPPSTPVGMKQSGAGVDMDALQKKKKELEARLAKIQEPRSGASSPSTTPGDAKARVEARLAALRAKSTAM